MENRSAKSKIVVSVIFFIFLVVVLITPNLVNKLLGSVNSIDITNNSEVKTGVVIDTDYLFDSVNNRVSINVYNGNASDITINSYIYKTYCGTDPLCGEFTVVNLDTPIVVKSNNDYEYVINDAKSKIPNVTNSSNNVGIQYSLEGKKYNLSSYVGSLLTIDSNSMNSKEEKQTEEEFVINSLHNPGTDDVYIKLSDNNIHMDITENLSDLNVTYKFRSNFANNWYYDSPIKETGFGVDMFGEPNKSNIKNFLNVQTNDEYIDGKGVFDYTSNKEFKINGTPKGTYTSEVIIPTFYFTQFKYIALGPLKSFEYFSTKAEDYSSNKIPQFKLTSYNKAGLLTSILNADKRLKEANKDEVSFDSWLEYYTKYVNAYELYQSRDSYNYCDVSNNCEKKDVNQAEIEKISNELYNYTFEKKASANYTEYNKIIKKIEQTDPDWYTTDSYEKFEKVYKERNNYLNLTFTYQGKLDIYVKKLNTAFDELVKHDANYDLVDSAIKSANLIKNITDDGKYEKYTKESWDALQDAIKAVKRGLKAEEQAIVDAYAVAISEAQAKLTIAPARYDKINEAITGYRNSEAYKNNWYVKETKDALEVYIKNIAYDKLITEQKVVDEWYDELNTLIGSLKLIDANYAEFNKTYDAAKALNEEYYVDFTKVKSALSKAEALSKNLTIDKQADVDRVTKEINDAVSSLVMKKANYAEFNKAYDVAKALNESYYVDFSKVKNALPKAEALSKDLTIDKQADVDRVTKEINDAVSSLVMKKANYAEFNKAYDAAKALNESYYVDFTKVKSALSKAEALSKDLTIDKQADVDRVTKEINDAVSSLVMKDADYSKINKLRDIIDKLDKDKYTNFDKVIDALNGVVYGKKINEQNEVDQMYNNVKLAVDNLEKVKADYSKLQAAISDIKRHDENKENYTNYDFVKKSLDRILAEIDYNLTWENQNKVDSWTEQINSALANLNKKPADYSKLLEIISKLPNDYSRYDKAIRDEISSFVKEVIELPNSLKYDEQYKIDVLVGKGEKLLDKLSGIVLDDNKDNNTNNGGNIIITTKPRITTTTKAIAKNPDDKKPNDDNKQNDITKPQNKKLLSYLKVNGNKVNIAKSPFKYTVSYDTLLADIEVGLTNDQYISKVYGASALIPGKNEVTIIVTDEKGKESVYKLIITRLKKSNYLSDLKVKNADIEFNKSKQEYTVKVDKNTDKLDLSIIPEDEVAKISVKGNKNLKNGSKVIIEVKSSDGNTRTYTLNIEKSSSIKVSIVIILILIFTGTIGLLYEFIQPNKKIKNNTN